MVEVLVSVYGQMVREVFRAISRKYKWAGMLNRE